MLQLIVTNSRTPVFYTISWLPRSSSKKKNKKRNKSTRMQSNKSDTIYLNALSIAVFTFHKLIEWFLLSFISWCFREHPNSRLSRRCEQFMINRCVCVCFFYLIIIRSSALITTHWDTQCIQNYSELFRTLFTVWIWIVDEIEL